MDQDAFRNLLSAPRNDAGPSRTHQKGAFGAAPPKRGWGLKQTKEHKTHSEPKAEKIIEHIAPRHAQKKQGTEGVYKDRAELRRAGKDDEYKDVEKMLADFEKRKAEAEDAETVEKTRQFLGGDATHSVLVKGLDYSLLAQRKAELEREKEVDRDEELDAMMDDIGSKPTGGSSDLNKQKEAAIEAERLGKGFKTIGRKEGGEGEKKKRKKKKAEVTTAAQVKVEEEIKPKLETSTPVVPVASASKPTVKPAPPPPDEDEDIFGDAGEYDLGAGAISDDDDDSEGEVSVKASPRGRSRSRENADHREHRYRSYSRSRSRSRSRERGDRKDYYRQRSISGGRDGRRHRDNDRSRDQQYSRNYNVSHRSDSRSRSRNVQHRQYRSPSRTPPRRYRSRSRSRTPPRRERYRSRSRSPYNDKRRRVDSPTRSPRRRRSPSPHRRRDDRYHSPSPPRRRSPSPAPPRATRRPTRSPSPFTFEGPPMSRSPSLSRSPSPVFGGKLQPLQSSAITDLSGFLAAESATAKADERKLKKAQWRSRQGLGVQEGVDPSSLKREMNDKQKSNREYVLLMNKLEKDKAAEGK